MTTRVALAVAAAFAAAWAVPAWPQAKVPSPPWPAGDERGMANAIGPATWARCAIGVPRR